MDPGRLLSMAGSIAHRGPDDEGFHTDGPIGFGFRRLAIVDLGGGHQPLISGDGRTAAVVVGEIYNHREVRRELERLGHRFHTEVDTEVVLHGYREWGDDVLARLNGIFALAVWDGERQRLLLARDRAGVKLLYYRLDGDELVFGSELRAVHAAGGGRASLDPAAVNLFLRYRYTPSPLTVHAGVRRLAAGTKLVADLTEAGRVSVQDYWDYEPVPFDRPPRMAEAREQLLARYRAAVRRQLMADVPVGLLLSGGVDSALLLALMAEHGERWRTFTVGYGESYPNDEVAEAGRTARRFGARHTHVRLDRTGFEADLATVVDALEEPIATASTVALYHVCRRAAEDVKVAFIGQGPDELFGGYARHLGLRYGAAWRAVPGPVRAASGSLLRRLPRAATVRRGLYSLGETDRTRRYQRAFSLLPGESVDALFRDDVLPPGAGDTILSCWADQLPRLAGAGELAGFQYLEVRHSLPDELLLTADKLSMWHSLELRTPYLDHEIIEYAGRLPASYKIRLGTRKWLHKQVCRAYLPPQIVHRRKRAFASDVVDHWYRESPSGMITGALLNPGAQLYQLLRPDKVRELVDEHRAGRHDHHKILFSLVSLELWLRRAAVSL
ncbi:asparagine synthase (glutamine-hydrolyzing) [Dactylosporangium sp. NPDC051484]|uniref:asparagine synthase (glutamine-hydrolyzing) n=1 Tax=Dactylosporangium sp. NPDC051484 TaxID=3154942 RepID=UPI00344F3032